MYQKKRSRFKEKSVYKKKSKKSRFKEKSFCGEEEWVKRKECAFSERESIQREEL